MKQVYLEGRPHSLKKIDICEYDSGVFGIYMKNESDPHMLIAGDINIESLRETFSESCN